MLSAPMPTQREILDELLRLEKEWPNDIVQTAEDMKYDMYSVLSVISAIIAFPTRSELPMLASLVFALAA